MAPSHDADRPEQATVRRRPRRGQIARSVAFASAAVVLLTVATALMSTTPNDALPAPKTIPSAYSASIDRAARSCPALSMDRLAGQIMGNSGFDPSARTEVGGDGIAGLTDEMWQQWLPWPNADRADPDANILALAHHMCDLTGVLRSQRIPGDLWRLALAAHRLSVDEVMAARTVPAAASSYVERVDGYRRWYAGQGGVTSVGPTVDPPADGAVTGTPAATLTMTPDPAGATSPPSSPGATVADRTVTTRPATLPRPAFTNPPPAPPPPAKPSTPTGAPPAQTPTTVRIGGFADMCVHVAYTNTADGTQIEMYPCNNGPAEVWTFATDGTVRALGKCMSLKAAGTANGTRVVLSTCSGLPGQQWRYTSSATMVNPPSGRCLDVYNSNTYKGVYLQLWDCHGRANQLWRAI